MSTAWLEHPEWGPALLVLLSLATAGLVVGDVLSRRRAARLLSARPPRERARRAADAALWLALASIAIALLGPRLGERTLFGPAGGADVVLLLDASRSMAAADLPPSRLDRARRAVAQLLTRLAPGDRVALASFAGRGVLFTPLTHDRDIIARMLPALDTEWIQPGGSDLAAGLEAAVQAFDPGSARPRVVIVASDGEQNGPRPDGARQAVLRAGVRVIAIALGSETGAIVPGRAGPLLDASGEPVRSRRNDASLAALTAASEGRLFRADRWGAVEVAAVADAVDRRAEAGPGARGARRLRVPLIAPFAALAAALLWLDAMPWRGRWRRRSRLLAAAPLLLLTLPGAGDGDAGRARALFARALEQAREGRGEAAQEDFLAAALLSRDTGLAALAHYNRGVIALGSGRLEPARNAFFEAVALRPDDEPARFNLEWTLAALAERADAGSEAAPEDQASARPGQEAGTGDAGERRETREAPALAGEAPGGRGAPGGRPTLSAEERARWLARVSDDPAGAMRARLRQSIAQQPPAARRHGPGW